MFDCKKLHDDDSLLGEGSWFYSKLIDSVHYLSRIELRSDHD